MYSYNTYTYFVPTTMRNNDKCGVIINGYTYARHSTENFVKITHVYCFVFLMVSRSV